MCKQKSERGGVLFLKMRLIRVNIFYYICENILHFMEVSRVYIQQSFFNGVSYVKGEVVDLLEKFNIACASFPFKYKPEAKDLPFRDWAGEDGRDVYIPKEGIFIKNYEVEASFLYKGVKETIHKDVKDFIDFVYGRNNGSVGAALIIYDEYAQAGRKDVHVASVSNDVYYYGDDDPDAIASFKVKFMIEDPTTVIIPEYGVSDSGDKKIIDLTFIGV